MASSDRPRKPRRSRGQYDPVLPADIPDTATATERQKLVGRTDPSVVRKKLVPQLPADYQRVSRTPMMLPTPARKRVTRGEVEQREGVRPVQRAKLTPPSPPPRVGRSPLAILPPPRGHAKQVHGGPDAPEMRTRRSMVTPRPPRNDGGGRDYPLSRKRVAVADPVVDRRSGMSELPPVPRVRGGVSTLPSLAPPSSGEFDMPEMRGFEERGITGVTTGHSYFHGGGG